MKLFFRSINLYMLYQSLILNSRQSSYETTLLNTIFRLYFPTLLNTIFPLYFPTSLNTILPPYFTISHFISHASKHYFSTLFPTPLNTIPSNSRREAEAVWDTVDIVAQCLEQSTQSLRRFSQFQEGSVRNMLISSHFSIDC